MTVGQTAYLDISYVEMVFNTSGPVTGYAGAKRDDGGTCRNVCVVDNVDVVGTPQEKKAAAGRTTVGVGLLLAAAGAVVLLV